MRLTTGKLQPPLRLTQAPVRTPHRANNATLCAPRLTV
jgi:hypothetical protein